MYVEDDLSVCVFEGWPISVCMCEGWPLSVRVYLKDRISFSLLPVNIFMIAAILMYRLNCCHHSVLLCSLIL